MESRAFIPDPRWNTSTPPSVPLGVPTCRSMSPNSRLWLGCITSKRGHGLGESGATPSFRVEKRHCRGLHMLRCVPPPLASGSLPTPPRGGQLSLREGGSGLDVRRTCGLLIVALPRRSPGAAIPRAGCATRLHDSGAVTHLPGQVLRCRSRPAVIGQRRTEDHGRPRPAARRSLSRTLGLSVNRWRVTTRGNRRRRTTTASFLLTQFRRAN